MPRAVLLTTVALALAAALSLAAPPALAVDGRLVDTTPPGGLRHLRVDVLDAHAEIDAVLPSDEDVTQARFAFRDGEGFELGATYAPAGPGETVHVRLAVPPGAVLLAASVADGAGNRGPETVAPVDGSLGAFTMGPREAGLAAVLALFAVLAGALLAPGRR